MSPTSPPTVRTRPTGGRSVDLSPRLFRLALEYSNRLRIESEHVDLGTDDDDVSAELVFAGTEDAAVTTDSVSRGVDDSAAALEQGLSVVPCSSVLGGQSQTVAPHPSAELRLPALGSGVFSHNPARDQEAALSCNLAQGSPRLTIALEPPVFVLPTVSCGLDTRERIRGEKRCSC